MSVFACMNICAPHPCLVPEEVVSLSMQGLGIEPRSFKQEVLLTTEPALLPPKAPLLSPATSEL